MCSLCRHCQRKKANRPRGLCWRCFYTPGVKELYPITSKFVRKRKGDFFGQLPAPPQHTQALPGSEAKLAALVQRAANGLGLWHPADATRGVQ